MASCGELAARLRAIAASLPTPALAAAAHRIQAAAQLLRRAEGDTETELRPCASALEAAASRLHASDDQLRHAAEWMRLYCTDILGVPAHHDPTTDNGTARFTPVTEALAQADTVGVIALPDYLEQHLFHGHSRYRKITGYHHRHGGLDRGRMRITDRQQPDDHGIYRATVLGPTTTGAKVAKARTTFFPDSWPATEVRRAVQAAFAQRRPVRDRDGAIIPAKWEGTYRGVTIVGYLHSNDVDLTTATIADVGSAFPLRRTTTPPSPGRTPP
ncbi:hypothetical protein GCM10022247_35380 [Allokutzneria multivorans]|uniref:Bacterial EndoU nuclease domain-containing protein n=1 Tax=Allokutzneria multivorans TaxID=1142134 RepID=A0ABP7SDL2_9PSEU